MAGSGKDAIATEITNLLC